MRHVVIVAVLSLASLRGPARAQELPRDPYAPTAPTAPAPVPPPASTDPQAPEDLQAPQALPIPSTLDPYAPAPPPVDGSVPLPAYPPPPPPPPAPPAPGPVPTVVAPTPPAPTQDQRLAAYEERALGILPETLSYAVAGFGNARVTSAFAYRGSTGNVLGDVPAFLEAVGEHERAATYRSRTHLRMALMLPGAALLIGGVVTTAVAIYQGDEVRSFCTRSGSAGCESTELRRVGIDNTTLGIGIGIAVGGAIVTIIGSRLSRPDLTVAEAMNLVERHNQRLRRELGLPARSDRPDRADRTPSKPRVTLAPTLGPQGGGLVLAGTF